MTTAPGPDPSEPPLTVGDYLDDWLRLHETQVQPSTWLSYSKAVRGYLQPALGDVGIGHLRAAQLNRLYVYLLAASPVPLRSWAGRCGATSSASSPI